MPHPICHIEIPTTDFEKSKKFYEALLGWTVELWPQMNYAVWKPGEGVDGGFQMWKKISKDKEATLVYALVESVDEYSRKAEALGGRVVVPKQAVGDMGWFAVIADTCGATIGLWESAKK